MRGPDGQVWDTCPQRRAEAAPPPNERPLACLPLWAGRVPLRAQGSTRFRVRGRIAAAQCSAPGPASARLSVRALGVDSLNPWVGVLMRAAIRAGTHSSLFVAGGVLTSWCGLPGSCDVRRRSAGMQYRAMQAPGLDSEGVANGGISIWGAVRHFGMRSYRVCGSDYYIH